MKKHTVRIRVLLVMWCAIMVSMAHISNSAQVLLTRLEGDFIEYRNFRIDVPTRGALTFKVVSQVNFLGDKVGVKFDWPWNDNCPEPGGLDLLPTRLFNGGAPLNTYVDTHIPVSKGVVDISVSGGPLNTGPYKLLVYFTEAFPSVSDKEHNHPFNYPLDLGIKYAYRDIDSHVGFPECYRYPTPAPGTLVFARKDYKDYFKFQFPKETNAYYNLQFATETPFRDECQLIVGLTDDSGYIYYRWVLNDKNEIGSFLMKGGKNYYIDVQMTFDFNTYGCHSGLKLGFVPASSAWFHAQEIIHEKTTVCGITETFQVVARNDGDAGENAEVHLLIFNPLEDPVYDKKITLNDLKEGTQKTVDFNWKIPDAFKEKNTEIITGKYKLEASVYGHNSGGYSTVKSSMDILCRSATPAQAFLILLLNN